MPNQSKFFAAVVCLTLCAGVLSPVAYSATAKAKPAAKAAKVVKNPAEKEETPAHGIIDTSYQEVQPLSLLQKTDSWVGEKVSFVGEFTGFHPYALDYKGAMRSSKDYISFLIRRPDVKAHTIPLSELKLVYPRKKAEKALVDLETGDKIMVKGKVFSAALGDPWVDVDEVVVLEKSPENIAKSKKKSAKHEDE